MSFTENTGVQAPSVKTALVKLADLVSGTALKIISLPAGAIVLGGHVYVSEAFNSTSSDALIIGDLDDDDKYKTTFSVQSTGLTALVPTGIPATIENCKTLTAKWTSGGGVPTTGKFQLVVQYIEPGRADFSQE